MLEFSVEAGVLDSGRRPGCRRRCGRSTTRSAPVAVRAVTAAAARVVFAGWLEDQQRRDRHFGDAK
ncbi:MULTISPECIES: hypothetical protein [Streptomyces]|uniref:Uncharacterized protein n=1 Tax=Streptomyces changanensis TaxID=2964669 RepID=A0ABY5NEY2_9ACTN|nr:MULTISPECIES: hypothetical protein [Streptomyces]UUS34619.1 hypothetical protein NRO40_29945 [Streptomyces changanensis]